jgi:hypothetical protein
MPFNVFLPAALAFAHLAFAAAEILARAAALILRLGFLVGFRADFLPLVFAQRALWAAAILARPAAVILYLRLGAAFADWVPSIRLSWL